MGRALCAVHTWVLENDLAEVNLMGTRAFFPPTGVRTVLSGLSAQLQIVR